MKKNRVTVAIITKDRLSLLEVCAKSFSQEASAGEELLIIDNSKSGSAKNFTTSLSEKTSFSAVSYCHQPIQGYASARNLALHSVQSEWLVFIDDDCVAAPGWLSRVRAGVRDTSGSKKVVGILGRAENLLSTNPYACAFDYINKIRKAMCIDDEGDISHYEILDCRNIIYNAKLLKKYDLSFNEVFNSGGEDIDLGLQIREAGLQVLYNPSQLVLHREPATFNDFTAKRLQYLESRKASFSQSRLEKGGQHRSVSFLKKLVLLRVALRELSAPQKLLALWMIYGGWRLFSKMSYDR